MEQRQLIQRLTMQLCLCSWAFRLQSRRRVGFIENGVTRSLAAIQIKRDRIAKKLGIHRFGGGGARVPPKNKAAASTGAAMKARDLNTFLGEQKKQTTGSKLLR